MPITHPFGNYYTREQLDSPEILLLAYSQFRSLDLLNTLALALIRGFSAYAIRTRILVVALACFFYI